MEKLTSLTFVISDLESGGAQRVLTTLANYWAENGRKIYIITFSDKCHDFYSLDDNIERIVLGGSTKSNGIIQAIFSNIFRIHKLRSSIKNINSNAVIGFIGSTNILLILASIGLSQRVIISERNDPTRQSLGNVWNRLRVFFYRRADLVTANSRIAIDSMSDYVPSEKLKLLRNPIKKLPLVDVDIAPYPFILAVGRLHYQKAYDILLKAFKKINKLYPDWSLIILGDGELKNELLSQTIELGLQDKIHWQGRVVYPLIYYKQAKFFVMPSRYEGVPNAMLEAMYEGLPVIISDTCDGALDYVQNNKSGLVTSVESVEELYAAMRMLIENEKLRKSMGKAARESVAACELVTVAQEWDMAILGK